MTEIEEKEITINKIVGFYTEFRRVYNGLEAYDILGEGRVLHFTAYSLEGARELIGYLAKEHDMDLVSTRDLLPAAEVYVPGYSGEPGFNHGAHWRWMKEQGDVPDTAYARWLKRQEEAGAFDTADQSTEEN